jgi:ribosomal protein L37E
MAMSVEQLIGVYVLSLLAALSFLAVYSEIRSRRFGPARKQDRIFRCERCGSIYTDDADVDRSRCSQCGTLNEPFEF